MKRISRIERVGEGLRVTMTDGTSATYDNAAQVPDEIPQLIARMDSEPDGGHGSQGDADAARSAYRQRLESAHEQGRLRNDPGYGLRGEAAYLARLQDGWRQGPPVKGKAGDHKHWRGA